MKFTDFANYLHKLDSTTKRLEMTAILSSLIKELPAEEIDKGLYLASGYLKAPFENRNFNIAEKMMQKTLEQTYGATNAINEMYREMGDLGNVALKLATARKCDLSLTEVYEKLEKLAYMEGTGSQDSKAKVAAELLNKLDPISAKYVVRIILGTMRLGFTELTIIDALANFLGDKSLESKIEQKFSIYPDIGLIAKKLKEKGINGLKDVKITTGIPILPQRTQRVKNTKEVIERMGTVWAEFKFDGTRVQLHFDKSKKAEGEKMTLFSSGNDNKFLIKTFTRNLEETTHMYPDLIEAAEKQITAKSAILDGEAVGYDKDTGEFLPFQEIMQRKRKYDIAEMAKEIPLKYFTFDLLYCNGETLIDKSLRERKKILKSIIKSVETSKYGKDDKIIVDDYLETDDPEKLYEYFELAKDKGLEGLIAKRPEDVYQAGARSFSWIKLKRADERLLDDSVDCVILGYYFGRGVRSKFGLGGFLVGIYDEKEGMFKTISKIGTGLTEETLAKLKTMCDREKIAKVPANVKMSKMFTPDTIVNPKIVVEIGADEISISPSHSAGYALRFPRLLKFRPDKSPIEATTLTEIEDMYKRQKRGLY